MEKEMEKEIFKRLERLEKAVFNGEDANSSGRKDSHSFVGNKINFELPQRNFVKTYSEGMNGEKKFTLLIAYLAKGQPKVDVKLDDVVSAWNSMTSKDLMGYNFNRKYTTSAKTNGWVDSHAKGIYQLTPTWKEIFD